MALIHKTYKKYELSKDLRGAWIVTDPWGLYLCTAPTLTAAEQLVDDCIGHDNDPQGALF